MSETINRRLAALIGGLCCALPTAFAQDATTPTPAPAAQTEEQKKAQQVAEDSADEQPEVVITGSRIRRTEFSTPAPVTIITAERSALAGLLSTEEILRGTTAASGQQVNDSFTGFVTDGGAGANQISLRGLGAQRTLVLVNGKRWSPSGVQGSVNSVDLTAIPSSMIGRIEILKDGASSVYGADAVAGVVNVITKESFDGLQLNLQALSTAEMDGQRYVADLSYGKVTDNGSISFSAQYQKLERLVRADRDWAKCDRDPRITDQDNDGIIDNTSPVDGSPLCFGFIYGLANTALGFLRYEPSLATPTPANRYFDPRVNGVFGVARYTRLPLNGLSPISPPATTASNPPLNALYDNDGAFYNDTLSPTVADIQPRSELISFTSFGQRDLDIAGGQSTAYYEAYWNRRDTTASGGYSQFFPVVNAVTDDGLALHPYNPLAAPFNARGLLGFAFYQPVMPSYELYDPAARVSVERYNVFAGIKGDFVGSWDYDVVVGFGHSEGTYRQQLFLADRVEAAINRIVVNPSTGAVTCSPAALLEFPNCVPANLSTADALLFGRLPQNVIDFIRKDTQGKTTYEGLSASAYLTGELFDMPAGAVSAVFGAEWRREEIDDVPDIEAQNNNFFNFVSAGITRGKDTVKEVFAELEVPLLKNKPFAESLVINGSARYTDYDSYGDDSTYRGTLSYQIIPEVGLRATFGTSFRAPDLYEQFLGDQQGFVSNLSDPCINYGARARPGDPLYDNCAAQGLAEDFFNPESLLSFTGGAGDLTAETSESFTAGIILKPEFIDLSVAVDYFDIQVEGTVASPSEAFLLSQCYNSPGFSSPFCSRIGPRDAQDVITFVDASFVNIGVQKSRGVDFSALYEREFEIGTLTLDFDATYLIEQQQELFGEVTDLEGRWGFPRWSAELETRFDWRDFRFAWLVDFIGESRETPVTDPGTTNIDRYFRTPNVAYHTLSVRYSGNDWQVIGTVRNVLNKDPPFISGGQGQDGANRFLNTLPGVGYDLFGRTFVLQVSQRW